jgi:TetR/AcrR family transcriptional regulator, copper-responsive repressor
MGNPGMGSEARVTKSAGRPRGFDREAALHTVLSIFWERGYDGTSVADLTAALGIAPPSLYAAFGDKRALFMEAVDTYYAFFVKFLDAKMLAADTAREAIDAVLHGVAEFYSSPDQPRGCLINTSPPPAGDGAAWAYLQGLRSGVRNRLRERIQVGVDAGELTSGADVDALADLYWNTILGMSMRSRDGASRAELDRTVAAVMMIWPGPDRR